MTAGELLDIFVQRRRNARREERLSQALEGTSDGAARHRHRSAGEPRRGESRRVADVSRLRGWRQNNRVENSHQPVRRRERGLQRFKSLWHAARCCSVFSMVCNQFRPGRHALSAANYRTVMRRRWQEWDVVSETQAFAVAIAA
jgi:putative transposase